MYFFHSLSDNNGSKLEVKVDEPQRYRICFSNREREEDKDEDMFSNDETDGEMDVKWYHNYINSLIFKLIKIKSERKDS